MKVIPDKRSMMSQERRTVEWRDSRGKSADETRGVPCIMGDACTPDHHVLGCEKFREIAWRQRKELAVKRALCLLCLRHRTDDLRKVEVCKRRHVLTHKLV